MILSGPDAFYKGPIADQIAEEMAKNGGLIGKADLANYKAVERDIVGEYRGTGYSPCRRHRPAASISCRYSIFWKTSILKIGLAAPTVQLVAEAEKYATDRSEYLSDPDFVKVPWRG